MKKQIEQTLRQVISRFPVDAEPIMTDILVFANTETGELQIFDDDDQPLATATIKDIAGRSVDEIVSALRSSIGQLRPSIQRMSLMQPFNFVLVDQDHEVLQDLVIIDSEDTMVIDVSLLDDLDADLDAFLKQLLED